MAKIITTHNRSNHNSPTAKLPQPADSLLLPQQAPPLVAQQTRMLSPAAIKITWRCGTHRLLNSSSKEAHRPVRPVLRLLLPARYPARDHAHAHDAETAAERKDNPLPLDACLLA